MENDSNSETGFLSGTDATEVAAFREGLKKVDDRQLVAIIHLAGSELLKRCNGAMYHARNEDGKECILIGSGEALCADIGMLASFIHRQSEYGVVRYMSRREEILGTVDFASRVEVPIAVRDSFANAAFTPTMFAKLILSLDESGEESDSLELQKVFDVTRAGLAFSRIVGSGSHLLDLEASVLGGVK